MSRTEIVFAIQIEFKGGTGKIKSFPANYYTLYELITINNRYNCCERNNFLPTSIQDPCRVVCVSDLMCTYLPVPIKASIRQICVTGHRYKTRTMSEHGRPMSSFEITIYDDESCQFPFSNG